jgi:hypothetical protein
MAVTEVTERAFVLAAGTGWRTRDKKGDAMPRRPPFNRGAIEARGKTASQQQARLCPYDFSYAFDILGVPDEQCSRCERELALICDQYRLSRRAEEQETPAAKAEALQRAYRLYPIRQRALERIAVARKQLGLEPEPHQGEVLPSEKDLHPKTRERIRGHLRVLQDKRWLAPSLEQEVMRLQLSTGRSWQRCCLELQRQYRHQSRLGPKTSDTLRYTIHRLQTFASGIDKKLTWRGGKIPPKLLSFLIAVLEAAGIKHPDFDNNASKFRRLLCKPAPGSVAAIGLGMWLPRTGPPAVPTSVEIELERQASKLYL